MTHPNDEELEAMAARLEHRVIDGSLAAAMLRACKGQPAPDHSEWNAAIEAAAKVVKGRADTARNKMSEAYGLGSAGLVRGWSSVISHLDLAHEAIRQLKKGQTND